MWVIRLRGGGWIKEWINRLFMGGVGGGGWIKVWISRLFLGADLTSQSAQRSNMQYSVLPAGRAASATTVVSVAFLPRAGLTVGLLFAATCAVIYGTNDITECDAQDVNFNSRV